MKNYFKQEGLNMAGGKYMYDLEVKDESKASWEYFVHELRRRLWNRNYVN